MSETSPSASRGIFWPSRFLGDHNMVEVGSPLPSIGKMSIPLNIFLVGCVASPRSFSFVWNLPCRSRFLAPFRTASFSHDQICCFAFVLPFLLSLMCVTNCPLSGSVSDGSYFLSESIGIASHTIVHYIKNVSTCVFLISDLLKSIFIYKNIFPFSC